MSEFVIVLPIYEDRASAMQLLNELALAYRDRIHVVAVDDGSIREPVETRWLEEAGLSGVVLTLTQNMGHQKAIAIGMSYAVTHFPSLPVVTMDSDGEDTPHSIRELMDASHSAVDIVVARRKSRIESHLFKLFYQLYKQLFTLLSGRSICFGNFGLYSPMAAQRLVSMPTLWIHIAATVLSSKLRIQYVPIDRGARYAGQSKMNFVALALHGFRSLMVFAEDVLVRVGLFCGATTALAMLGIFIAVVLKIIGLSTPGWFSVIIGVFIVVMMQTGLMTLTTLLLTGVMKGNLSTPPDYRVFIKSTHMTSL